jgi:hypothetical protein
MMRGVVYGVSERSRMKFVTVSSIGHVRCVQLLLQTSLY